MKNYALIEMKKLAGETPLQRLVSLHFAYQASRKEAAKSSAKDICPAATLGRTDVAFVPVMACQPVHPKAAR